MVGQSSTGIISSELTVYSSVSQNIFMVQFRCIKDLHSFSSLSLSFSKWSQITSIFTFRKVLIVPRCKQGRYETVLISYFLRYDLCSNFFLYTFELTLWQKNSYNWIHTYLFVKSFFVGVSILYIHYNNLSWYFLKCIGIKLINWVQYFKHFKHTNIWIISRFLLFFKNFSICEGGWFDSFDIFCCNCMGLCIFLVFFFFFFQSDGNFLY